MIYKLGDFHFPDSAARLYPHAPTRPWLLEIGFGDGRFWPHYAATFSQKPNYLGVEISGTSLLKAQRRLREAGLEGGILTKLPAEVLLREVVPAGGLSQIVVNFPDPWPKAGHEDHRLLRAPFFRLAASRLAMGGSLLLTTDHAEYFAFACAEAQKSGVMRAQRSDVDGIAPPLAALETKYALKWRDLGLSVHHARFTPASPLSALPAEPPSGFCPFPHLADDPTAAQLQENNVPHAIVTLPDHFSPAAFAKHTARDAAGRWTVVLLELHATLPRAEGGRRGWSALAHVVEGDLTQEVLIDLTPRPDGSALVRLSRFGGPIITPAVKAAVGVFTEVLEADGAQVQRRGY